MVETDILSHMTNSIVKNMLQIFKLMTFFVPIKHELSSLVKATKNFGKFSDKTIFIFNHRIDDQTVLA